MSARVLVHLRCEGCRGIFFAPRAWWAARLDAGLPDLRCKGCEPEWWRTDLADRPKPQSQP